MRLFSYYAWHSFINQLKKLFKTWVIVFILVCGLVGGLIGYGAARLSEITEEPDDGTVIEDVIEGDPIPVVGKEEFDPEFDIKEHLDIVELVAGGAVFAILMLFAYSADSSGGKIFLPADVNLLFSSPMKPQAVLMFRLITKLGFVLFMCIYFLLEVPALRTMGLETSWVLMIYPCVFMTLVYGQLLQMYLYLKTATDPRLKKYLLPGCGGVLGAVIVALIAYKTVNGLGTLDAALGLFCAPFTRFIPVWGWVKAMYACFIYGDYLICAGLTLLNVAVIALMVYGIWHMKVDFYEDAMSKAEETARQLREIDEKGSLFARKKKKGRSEKMLRDGMNKGSGANVYFYKSMYNRRRFGKLGFFTKTCITYLIVSAFTIALSLFVFDDKMFSATALALGVMVFYRATGNPLEQDIQTPYFVLIPDKTIKKLFWSVLGSSVNSMLDLIPGLGLAAVVFGVNPLIALAWLIFIVSVDFYSTNVGTFINVSIPASMGKVVKQMIQVMFIYFGLLPDIAAIALGFAFERIALAVAAASAINVMLGVLFMALCANFIAPTGSAIYTKAVPLADEEYKAARRNTGRFMIMAAVSALAATVFQLLSIDFIRAVKPEWFESDAFIWLYSLLPIYVIGLPLGMLFMRGVKRTPPLKKEKLGTGNLIVAFLICEFLMLFGNVIGQIVSGFINEGLGIQSTNAIEVLIGSSGYFWQIACAVILGPIMEEIIFRKLACDTMGIYGEGFAITVSALCFGLFHANLYQFFYAFFIGLVFAYIYIRTGKLRYSIALHMGVNFLGSVVPMWVTSHIDMEALEVLDTMNEFDMSILRQAATPGNIIYMLYVVLLLTMAMLGFVLLCIKIFDLKWTKAPKQLSRKQSWLACLTNPGFYCFLAVTVGMTIYSALA